MENFELKLGKSVYDVFVRKQKYAINKRVRIDLIDSFDGSPVCTATTNIPDIEIPKDFVIIKDYSENSGVYQSLVSAGVVSEKIDTIMGGCYVCKLLV